MKLLKAHTLFILLLITATLLRFTPLFEYQFTYDELSGLDRTQFPGFAELIEKGVKVDAHPALIQVLIFYLVKWFGYTTWIIKLPFLLCSLGAILYAYLFGLRYFSRPAGLYAAAFFSFSLVFVFYAPIARMYIPGVFFSLAMLYYFFAVFFRHRHGIANFMFLGIFTLLSAYNHHLNALFALTLWISAFFFLRKELVLKFFLVAGAIVLLYLPHLPVTFYQLGLKGIGTAQGGWLEPPRGTALFDTVGVLLGTGKCWLLVLLLVFAGLFSVNKPPQGKGRMLLLVLFVVNFAVIYVYSLLRAPVFQYSVMLFSGAAFILLVSSLLPAGRVNYFYASFAALVAMLGFQSYVIRDYLRQSVKTVFEYQFERTFHYKKLYGDQNVFPLFFDADTLMKNIYFKKYKGYFDCRTSADTIISYGSRRLYDLAGDTAGKVSSVYLFAGFISQLQADYVTMASSTPLYQAIVRDHFPFLIENTQTQGIHFKVYSRKGPSIARDDEVISVSALPHKGSFNYTGVADQYLRDLPLRVNGEEYPFKASATYGDVVTAEGQFVLARSLIRYSGNPEKGPECCIAVEDPEKKNISYNSKAASDFLPGKDSGLVMYSDLYIGDFHRKRQPEQLSCYLWNRSGTDFVLGDFEIRVISHWPRKWHFWD